MRKKVIEKIKDLEGIIDCKITGEKEIDEIHIIASKERQPKRIVRDIETLILVNLDREIDHKKISIAQINNKEEVIDDDNRIIIDSIYREHNKAVVHLNLQIKNKSIQKKITDEKGESVPVMVARGIIELVECYTDFCGQIRLKNVFTTGFNNEIVIVQLNVVNNSKLNQEKLLGAVDINNDLPLATAKACLKALNRIITC